MPRKGKKIELRKHSMEGRRGVEAEAIKGRLRHNEVRKNSESFSQAGAGYTTAIKDGQDGGSS